MSTAHRDFVDAVTRATAKFETIAHATHEPLTQAQVFALAAVFRRDVPAFGDRVLTATIADAGATYFERVRILRMTSAVPFPAQTAYAAWLPTGPVALTGHPSALDLVNAEERSRQTSDPDLVVALAGVAGVWVGASRLLEVRLSTIDDVPFRGASDDDRVREAAIRQEFASRIAPPEVERLDDGVRLTMWIVSESRLRRRVAEVRSGAIAVSEEVLADVPAFPGAMWAMRNGRFVPIG